MILDHLVPLVNSVDALIEALGTDAQLSRSGMEDLRAFLERVLNESKQDKDGAKTSLFKIRRAIDNLVRARNKIMSLEVTERRT